MPVNGYDFLYFVDTGFLSAFFTLFLFSVNSSWGIAVGVILWGIGMGAQESILKAAVTTLTPKESRSTGFGIMTSCFGFCWFLGSWFMGWLYDVNLFWLVVFSVTTQLLAIPLDACVHLKAGQSVSSAD